MGTSFFVLPLAISRRRMRWTKPISSIISAISLPVKCLGKAVAVAKLVISAFGGQSSTRGKVGAFLAPWCNFGALQDE